MKKLLLLCFIFTILTACGSGVDREYFPIIPPVQDITGIYSLIEMGATDWIPDSGQDCSFFASSQYAPYHGILEITNQGFDMERCFVDRPRGAITESCWEDSSVYPATDDPGILFDWLGRPTDPKYVYPYMDGEMWPYYFTYDQDDPKGSLLTIWTGISSQTNRYDYCIFYSTWEKIAN